MVIIKYLKKWINKLVSGDDMMLSQQIGLKADGDYVDNGISDRLRQLGAEGCVLLKNDGALPLKADEKVNIFGRVFFDYYYVGFGSGGDVIAPYKVSVRQGFDNYGINYNKPLCSIYEKYCSSPLHTPDEGTWGTWPTNRIEMKVSDNMLKIGKEFSDTAIVFIGRGAGEDRDISPLPGGYYLDGREKSMLLKVTASFKKTIVVLNIGNVMDLSWIKDYDISAVLCVWEGGMESGNALACVLSGKVNPSGKLTASFVSDYKDYPSAENYGDKYINRYVEDVFVGYRYFNTFAPEKVVFPFGFGLSYTDFKIKPVAKTVSDGKYLLKVSVLNVGKVAGKEVVQAYVSCPQGKLGKSKLSLVGFAKTTLLEPGQEQILEIAFDEYTFASFDDVDKTGNKGSYVLEAGEYSFYVGNSVVNTVLFFKENKEEKVYEKLTALFPLKDKLNRAAAVEKDGKLYQIKERLLPVSSDLKERIIASIPKEIPYTGDKGYKLKDVLLNKVSMDDFIAQLDDTDLEEIAAGEGEMHSSLGAAGNAGAMCGVTQKLRDFGIPPVITSDGPSGIRLKKYCSLLPCGSCIAATWDVELIEKTFAKVSEEMAEKGSDILLAPGMNIQRNPLCGRNFEYFSEDPLVSGKIASAIIKGIQSRGVSACPKHFACNNQEYKRIINDSVVSERALREIYLKGFEICVKESEPQTIMTSYNKINGVWSHYNFDLAYILREEWGFNGTIMTDWWMRRSYSPEFPVIRDNGYRVRAKINVLMPGNVAYGKKDTEFDKTVTETLGKEGGLTRAEMQQNAKEVLNVALYKLKNTLKENRL